MKRVFLTLNDMRSLSFTLKPKDVTFLRSFKKGERGVRALNRANTLLLLHRGKPETKIAEFLGTNFTTVWRTKKKYLDQGLAYALAERLRPGQPKKYTVRHETELVAHACSTPPEGRKRWTLELLSEKMQQATKECRTMNRETVRLMLKKMNVSLG